MNLVIVESPSKAKTINKYLGKEYVVKASKGHIADLPKSKLGVDPEKNFKPEYEVTNKKSLLEIKKAFKDAKRLILAVDLDREGEAIGWHIAKELKVLDDSGKIKGKKPVERIVFSEISKEAIESAIKNPRSIDMNLVNSQQARRILDRLVGYKLSPLLWKKISFGLSAGRVQSVALRLIVEREEERNKFKSDEYWSVESYLSEDKHKSSIKVEYILSKKEGGVQKEEDESDENEVKPKGVKFELSKIDNKKPELPTQAKVEKIIAEVKDKNWIISDVQKSSSKKYAKPPFITSTLQQTAVNLLGFTAKRTMSASQKLYEAGHITYMRTDAVTMSTTAIAQGRKYIEEMYGAKFLPEKQVSYKSSNKSAQEAHECIRPVNFYASPDSLSLQGDEKKVYDLIWRRALASLMSPAEIDNLAYVINIAKYEFRSTGSTINFPGYLKVYSEKISESLLPELQKGQVLNLNNLLGIQHFTQPPARYSEATLIKKMEELGIGRPSTYASIISTIVSRKYVEKEGKYLYPTDMGVVVNKMLVKYFSQIVDYGFTADMEGGLDKIAEGNLDWKKMLKDFYFPFEKEVLKQDKAIPRSEFTELGKSDEKCDICGKKMVVKLGRYGKFLSCSDYPKCKGMKSIEDVETEGENSNSAFDLTNYEEPPKTEDGREYTLKRGRFGNFWAHPDYPKVKDAKPLVMKRSYMEEKFGDIPKTKDGRDYLLKSGKFGYFWAHPDYPKEKDIIRVKIKK